ncbi:major facilitator superfamily domain-containing protein [Lentinula aciculospora]|uniref:Major facilitator superfamily domain-containing protein n=1 Tax=Lentinula aciculospora TaxID=153920 RepID=A0A9W8ZUR2_9AGAR|nr:major facilitator superfamily domain-containing protein [Lentinula aciculospora]
MLWTVFEESSEDGDYYDGPPPGDLDNFYAISNQLPNQDVVVPGPSTTHHSLNEKKEVNEKHVEEMVIPAVDELEDHQAEDDAMRSTEQQSIDFPDGGLRAWLVVLGTFFSAFASFGYVNAWGVFQAYYEETMLTKYSPSTIAWIGSVQYAFVLLPALFSGRLFDLGIFKIPFLGASILVVTCTVLVGQCTQYWHFFLCQGVALGIGCGMVFGPAMGIIGQWFRKKRGLATGLTALGSSVGGTVFPIAAQRLIPRVGFPWTMRILGFILLFALVISNITLSRRLPPRNVSRGLFNLAAFSELPFSMYAMAVITGFLGLYTVLTYIDLSALAVGVSPDMAVDLVAIANASSGFGRIAAGLMADRIGALNFIAPTTLFAGMLSYAWPFARTKASLLVIAVLYGFMCGSFVSGLLLPVYELGGIADTGQRTGMIMSIGAAGALCGIPISGAINKATGGFEVVGYYAGSITIVSVIFMLITRQLVLKKLWGKF